jgi:hypothetical protein
LTTGFTRFNALFSFIALSPRFPSTPECSWNVAWPNLNFNFKFDEFVKSPKTPFSVIPVKTGIQEIQELLASRSPPARGQASRE